MKELNKQLTSLIRVGLGSGAVDASTFTYVNWMRLLEEAYRQGVHGVVWSGIQYNPEIATQLGIDEKMEFFGQTRILQSNYEEYKHTIASLSAVFAEQGMKMMKGQRVLLDTLQPEFSEELPNHPPHGFWNSITYDYKKTKRLWKNRWKYKMVYNESLWQSF